MQERTKQIEGGRKLAKALLFIGCQHPHKDRLYHDELASWASKGAVEIRYAFSRDVESSNGAKYVQERFWDDREDVLEYFRQGAKVFVCGNGKMSDGVKEAAKKMHKLRLKEQGMSESEEDTQKWFESLRNERYMSDVFD